MEKTKTVFILVLCGCVVFLGIVVLGVDRQELTAQGTVNSNQDMIAVTGTYSSGVSALYLIDTRTRQLAVYAVDAAGNKLRLVAARNITYDMKIPEYNDGSEEKVKVENLKKDWLKFNKAREK